MSECEKAKIVGYIEQTSEQIKLINEIKMLEADVLSKIIEIIPESNQELRTVGKHNIMSGFMFLVRSIARRHGG